MENITQKKEGDNTNYTLDVNNDTSNSVSYLKFYIDGTAKCGSAAKTMDATTHELDDTTNCVVKAEKSSLSSTNNTFSAVNGDSAHSITAISYYVGDTPVVIFKSEFEDFFKAGSNDLMVYSNK